MITPLLLPFSLTFQRGDPIPMMNRTQYAAQRTRWTEVPLGVAPRFGIDERLLLPPVHGVGYGEDFKVSFALLQFLGTCGCLGGIRAFAAQVRRGCPGR